MPRSFLVSLLAVLATSSVALWAGYDRPLAGQRFGLIALGVALAILLDLAVRRRGERAIGGIGVVAAVAAALLGLLYLVTQDWQVLAGEFAPLRRLGVAIQQGLAITSGSPVIHRNAVAGALVILLPLGAGSAGWAWQRRAYRWSVVTGVALTVGLIALLLTVSRGAWIGLGGALLLTTYLRTAPGARRERLLLLAILLLLASGFWLAVLLPVPLPQVWALNPVTFSRVWVWRTMLPLVHDYPFTGSGLQATSMIYSSYSLLLATDYFYHAHNLFLQVAIEQGVPGLLAFMSLIGSGGHALLSDEDEARRSPFWGAAFASIAAMLFHGVVDAELYASSLVVLFFLPPGLAVGVRATQPARTPVLSPSLRHGRRPAVVALALLLGGFLLLPAIRATFHANLGAVTQSRAELSRFDWRGWKVQDAVRRSPEIDLSSAIRYYHRALALDPNNGTANRRLGQIYLSWGRYREARHHLGRAFDLDPHNRTTGQLLGELYALAGDPERAVELWVPIDTGQGQLQLRRSWYQSRGDRLRTARMEAAIRYLQAVE